MKQVQAQKPSEVSTEVAAALERMGSTLDKVQRRSRRSRRSRSGRRSRSASSESRDAADYKVESAAEYSRVEVVDGEHMAKARDLRKMMRQGEKADKRGRPIFIGGDAHQFPPQWMPKASRAVPSKEDLVSATPKCTRPPREVMRSVASTGGDARRGLQGR